MIEGAVKPLEVRETGKDRVYCLRCGGDNSQGNHVFHYQDCVCPICGDSNPGYVPWVMWHKPECPRSNYHNKFGRAWGDADAEDYWILRSLMQGYSKIGVSRAMGYRTAWKVNDTLYRLHGD